MLCFIYVIGNDTVKLLMTSFDFQLHHAAARHFVRVIHSLGINFPELGYTRNMLAMWENLVEIVRNDLKAERLNHMAS